MPLSTGLRATPAALVPRAAAPRRAPRATLNGEGRRERERACEIGGANGRRGCKAPARLPASPGASPGTRIGASSDQGSRERERLRGREERETVGRRRPSGNQEAGQKLTHTRPRRPPPPLSTVRAAAALAETDLDVTAMAPLGDRLLVRPREAATTSAGGVLLASGATQELADALIGTVVAVGEDVDVGVAVGETVLFVKYASSDVKTAGGDVCFVSQKSVLAKLE